MIKRSKLIYIIGSIIIGIIALLIVFSGLALGGVFSDSRVKLIFSSASGEFEYDGEKHADGRWELVSGELKSGHTAVVEVTGSRTDAGSSENYISATIKDGNGNDVSEDYEIEYQAGSIKVLPRKITVASASASKEYDGLPLSMGGAENYKITYGELLDGHELAPYEETTIVNAGITANSCAHMYVYDSKGRDKTDNYEITTEYGVLEITPRKISVEADSEVKVYDGEPLTCPNLSITSESDLIEGHYISWWDMPAEALNVGSWENYISAVRISDADGEDVTGNYSVDFHSGKLIVTPRPLTIRSGSSSKEYDGLVLTNYYSEIVSITQPVEGHTVEVKISGERTEIGESENTIAEVKITTADGEDVTYNYDVKKQAGVLRINAEESSETDPAGGGMLDESGQIGGGESGEQGEPQLALRVKSDVSESIYLRYMNFGDYLGRMWGSAEPYQSLINGKFCANYLTGEALKLAGYTSNAVSIQSFAGYFIPYYPDMFADGYTIQTSDVKYVGGSESIYSLYYYLYDYVQNGALSPTLSNSDYAAYESAYSAFVKEHYLAVRPETASALEDIVSLFDVNDPQLIAQVAQYVQGAAEYNLDYDRALDEEEDIIVSFLKDDRYNQGICQHYASAATVLYRLLGIPARYVIGFVGETTAGSWVEITSEKAHAWVEVYIDGFGWVNVEVTGGGFNGGGNGSGDNDGEGGNGDDNNGDDNNGAFVIKPATEYYKFDGVTSFSHSGKLQGISKFEQLGLTYKVTISDDTRRDLGKTEIKILSLSLFKGDTDVTGDYKITQQIGYLYVYEDEIDITTSSAEKTYDGTALTDSTITATPLQYGHTYEILKVTGSQTAAGVSDNIYEVKIVDKNGEDVTDTYKINPHYGTLTVIQKAITITAWSAEKTFDGTALQANGYDIDGELVDGHTAVVVVSGSQTKVGESKNRILSVKIYDENNQDVTDNYYITEIVGTLKVNVS